MRGREGGREEGREGREGPSGSTKYMHDLRDFQGPCYTIGGDHGGGRGRARYTLPHINH